MRNAAFIVVLALGATALAACHNAHPQQNQTMSLDENIPASELPDNVDIETLPADESSTTPSNQLQNGYDNPDVNNLGNSH